MYTTYADLSEMERTHELSSQIGSCRRIMIRAYEQGHTDTGDFHAIVLAGLLAKRASRKK